jgi:hypothetical protein
MRQLICNPFQALALAVLLASPALAAEAPSTSPTLALSPEDVQSWSQVGQALDQCVAGLQLRNDPAICRGLSQWLAAFAGRVAIASKSTVPAAANPPAQSAPAPKPAGGAD